MQQRAGRRLWQRGRHYFKYYYFKYFHIFLKFIYFMRNIIFYLNNFQYDPEWHSVPNAR